MNLERLCALLFLLGCAFLVKAENRYEPECDNGHWQCLITKKCIALSWRCDTDSDCGLGDNSDEENCPPKTCAEGEYNCRNSTQCIAERWKCDGDVDCRHGDDEEPKLCLVAVDLSTFTCPEEHKACNNMHCVPSDVFCDGIHDCDDGSDEYNCTKTCGEDMHTCSDGQCISSSWVCDGDDDCLDKSDERACKAKVCDSDQFKCGDSSRCIDVKWRCDGDFDCPDHSDETMNCSSIPNEDEFCSPTADFECKINKECIHKSWRCDGDPDCTDLSDEGPECNYTCRTDQFKCDNHACISQILVCDGNADCMDSSDERNCTKPCDVLGEFDCNGDGSMCVPNERVCDGRNDCLHREDEDPMMCKDATDTDRNPCWDHECPKYSQCKRTPFSNKSIVAKCICDRGFEWVEKDQACQDINECELPGTCSQICVNTKGGYKCECKPGYFLEHHFFCRAIGEPSWLYYANRRDIRRLRADSRYSEILVEDTENSIALDFDYEDGLMFWTDVGLEQIKRAKIDNGGVLVKDMKTVVQNNDGSPFSPDGLAVDWLYKNIYWTDTGSNKIKVSNYDGTKIKTLIDAGLDDPRAICVDPENGYMYWTDWGQEPKIERCGMDGNNRETIVAGGEHLEWPNGLTIDYIGKRIYWIDSKLHKIGTAELNGNDAKHVLVDAIEVRRPFSISVFEDTLYWTDWSTNSIKSVHKTTGGDRKTLSIGSYAVMDIKVYHELRQERHFKEQATQLCNAAQCESLCLPAARTTTTSNATVSCVCGDGQKLNQDKRTCTTAASTAKPPVTTPKPATPTAKPPVTGKPGSTEKPGTTEKPSTQNPVLSTQSTSNDTSTVNQPGDQEGQGAGGIAIIAAGVAVVVIASIFVVGCVIYRRYRSRNKKSMNFDNPVYRKTTTSDDNCVIRNEPQMEPLTGEHETV